MGKSKNNELSPEDVAKIVGSPDAKARREQLKMDRLREEAFVEGLKAGRQELLDWLQYAYIDDPGRPDRGTPKAQAILELARDASKFIRDTLELKKARDYASIKRGAGK